LRHADAGNKSGGADPARSDPDLDCIRASLGQIDCSSACGHIAGNDLHVWCFAFEPFDTFDGMFGMAVSDIEDHHGCASM
jgi:hypothetical protein